jgi:hypothetical protein
VAKQVLDLFDLATRVVAQSCERSSSLKWSNDRKWDVVGSALCGSQIWIGCPYPQVEPKRRWASCQVTVPCGTPGEFMRLELVRSACDVPAEVDRFPSQLLLLLQAELRYEALLPTASRLVFRPLARSASRIRFSSTMLVRMMYIPDTTHAHGVPGSVP